MVNWVLRKEMKWLQSFTHEDWGSNKFSSAPQACGFFTFVLLLTPHLLPLLLCPSPYPVGPPCLIVRSLITATAVPFVSPGFSQWVALERDGWVVGERICDPSCFATMFLWNLGSGPCKASNSDCGSSDLMWFSPLAAALGVVGTSHWGWSLGRFQYPLFSLKAARTSPSSLLIKIFFN